MINKPLLTYTSFAKALTFPLLKFMEKPINLKTLLNHITVKKIVGQRQNPIIRHLAVHSNFVQPHSIFFSVPGEHFDGNNFIETAISRGAKVIITEKPLPRLENILQIQVPDVRSAMSQIAHTFYDAPDEKLRLIGITGTSGKTTTSWILRHIYQEVLHENSGVIGSLQYDLGQRVLPASRTTPDAISLTSYLDEMVQNDEKNAILEISSHAIAQKRVSALTFDTAAFTNLSLEHLDYHKTMEAYFRAKQQLFFNEKLKHAVVNLDDAYGQRLFAEGSKNIHWVTVGIHAPAMIRAKDVQTHLKGTSFTLITPKGEYAVTIPLLGLFNVYNSLVVLGICYAQGYDLQRIIPALSKFPHVPGRLEEVRNDLGVKVFVDYAHKPEALKNVLNTVRQLTDQKLFVVFGCGGDRDRTKRPVMTHIAETYADGAWATSDNPRTEDQEQIFNDMRMGLASKDKVVFVKNRAEAIYEALKKCRRGDCLIIAGKGHEQYQEIGQQFFPFDDRKVVEAYNFEFLNK